MSEDGNIDIVEPSSLQKEIEELKTNIRRDLGEELELSKNCGEIDEVQGELEAEELDYDPVSDDENAASVYTANKSAAEGASDGACEGNHGDGELPEQTPEGNPKAEQVELIEIEDDSSVIDLVDDADEEAVQFEEVVSEPKIERLVEPELPVPEAVKGSELKEVLAVSEDEPRYSSVDSADLNTGQSLELSQSPSSLNHTSDDLAVDLEIAGEYLKIPVVVDFNGPTPLWNPSSPRHILNGPPAADMTLDSLFVAVRKHFEMDSEMETFMLVPQLDLELGEDNLYCNETMLLDLLRLLDTCDKTSSSLEITIQRRPRFVSKLNALFEKLNDLPPAKKTRLS